jgi:decaprenyl-phosphate phosphoribosyltransferase
MFKLLRPRQWIKNAFVLAPLLFSGEFQSPDAIKHALLAVLLFCLAASAGYVVNDLKDIERDRRHPKKSKTRPLASGIVSRHSAYALLFLLYSCTGCGMYFFLPALLPVLAAYLVLNLAYSCWLKHEPVVDIFCIAIGFVLRIYAGALALAVPVSSWMFITTLCLALYLAAVKRRQELLRNGDECRLVLTKYSVGLIDRYAEMAATGALVFYSLFVMSARPQLVMSIPLRAFRAFPLLVGCRTKR